MPGLQYGLGLRFIRGTAIHGHQIHDAVRYN